MSLVCNSSSNNFRTLLKMYLFIPLYMVSVVMDMLVSIIALLVPLASSNTFNHNSCFNDSGNLSAPTDEYALISLVSEVKEFNMKTYRKWFERFKRIEVAGIPSANHLYSATLQDKEHSGVEYWSWSSTRYNIYRYPIMAKLDDDINYMSLISLTPDFKTIQTCPLNGYYEKYGSHADAIQRFSNSGLMACTGPSFEKANCTLYRFHDPETSKCEQTELSDHICYAGWDQHFFVSCQNEIGHIKAKELSFETMHGLKEEPSDQLLAQVGPTSELYDLAFFSMRDPRLTKIVLTLLGNELHIDVEHQTVYEPKQLDRYGGNLFEGPADANKLLVARYSAAFTIDLIMAPDTTFEHRIGNWPPLNITTDDVVMRRPAKLVPICRKITSTAREGTNKANLWSPMLLIVFIATVFVILPAVIGLLILAARRRRSHGNNSKIAIEQNALVNRTWVFKLKEMVGLTRPSCLVVKGIQKKMETDRPRLGEPISDGSTINVVDTNEVFKERYQSAEERRIKRQGQSNVGKISNQKKSKTNNLESADVIMITRRPDQYTGR